MVWVEALVVVAVILVTEDSGPSLRMLNAIDGLGLDGKANRALVPPPPPTFSKFSVTG